MVLTPAPSCLRLRHLALLETAGRLGAAHGTTSHHELTYEPGMLNGARSGDATDLSRSAAREDRARTPTGASWRVHRRWSARATVEVAAAAPRPGCASGIPARWSRTVDLNPTHNSAPRRMGGGGGVRR